MNYYSTYCTHIYVRRQDSNITAVPHATTTAAAAEAGTKTRCNNIMELHSMDQDPMNINSENRKKANLSAGDCFLECRECGSIKILKKQPRCVVLTHTYH